METLLIIILTLSLKGFCQIIDLKHDTYWIEVGAGVYISTDSTQGHTISLSANMFSIDSTFYKIKLNGNQEFQFMRNIIDPIEHSISVGVLIGKGYSWKYFQMATLGGLGFIRGVKRGKFLYADAPQIWFDIGTDHYEKIKFFTPSIPLEVDFTLKPIKYFGIGAAIFCDLNLKRPMWGPIYKVGIGKLK